MSPVAGCSPKNNSFTFLSFLQCDRHSKSVSRDSGISAGAKQKSCKGDVIVISDDESEIEPEYEMLWEVKFDSMDAIPLPIEQKLICKAEPECLEESNITIAHHPSNQSLTTLKEEQDATVNLGECEDELLSLCKVDQGEPALNKNDNYIIFMCPQCGQNFNSSETWKNHIDKVHNLSDQRTFNFTQRPNNKFQCNKCKAIITRCTLKTLQQHRFTHLPYKVYKCKLCRHENRSLYLMISHIMLHKDKELCIIGAKGTKVAVTTAVVEHESKQFIAYICPVCGDSFDTEDIWQAHINFKHNFLEKTAENRFDDHFKCTECSVEIFSQHVGDLQKHLFTHLPYKSFLKCKICNWTISRENFMISHIFNLHKTNLSHGSTTAATTQEAPVQTPLPNRSNAAINATNNPSHFVYDDDEDVEDKSANTVCDTSKDPVLKTPVSKTIDKSTANSSERRYRKQGFMCVCCGQCYPTAAERNAHNVAEHAKYKCDKCNEPFAVKRDWKAHNCKRETCFACPQCTKEYNYEKCLNNHLRRCQRTQRLRKNRTCFY